MWSDDVPKECLTCRYFFPKFCTGQKKPFPFEKGKVKTPREVDACFCGWSHSIIRRGYRRYKTHCYYR